MELVTIDEYFDVYDVLESNFSEGELRTFTDLLQKNDRNDLTIYANKDNNEILSVAVVWRVLDYAYVEYLCVNKNYHSKGLGGKMLQEIIDMYDKVVLEVSENISEEEARRIKFYERYNFHYYEKEGFMQPLLHDVANTHKLHLMTCPNMLDDNKYKEIKKAIFEKVYKVEI